MGKRQVHVVRVRKAATIALLALITAAMICGRTSPIERSASESKSAGSIAFADAISRSYS